MALSRFAALVALALSGPALAQTWTALTPYASSANSPFFATQTVNRQYYLEDFEDMSIDSRGLSIPDGILHGPGPTTDSVDIDDYTINSSGTGGVSLYPAGTTLTLMFDNAELGGYPTKVGFVWTDGLPGSIIQVVATNPQNISVAQLYGPLGDVSNNGATTEDRFIGISWPAGVAQLQIQQLSPLTTEIDHVQYSAPVLAPLYVRDRVNSDVYADLLWRNTSNAITSVWYMTGLTKIGGGPTSLVAPLSWVAQGCGDFDDDGDTDILWRDAANVLHVWLMQGQTVSTNSVIQGAGAVAATWVVIGVADYDGDRKADILFRSTVNSDILFWKMNGNAFAGSAIIGNVAGFEYLGSGDFNGDGRYDVLWRQTSTGTVTGWLMNGFTPIESAAVGNTAPITAQWVVGAIGDLNADGRADVIWRNSATGVVNCWLMNNLYRVSGGLTSPISLDWKLRAAADITGDGKVDILWTNPTNGKVNAWVMNGITKVSSGTIATVPNLANWSLINH